MDPGRWLIAAAASALAVPALAGEDAKPAAAPRGEVRFRMHRVGSYRSEACGVGDFNGDGKLDIVAGAYLYLAPDWKAQKIRTLRGEVDSSGKGYMWDFMNLPVVTGKWGGPVWFENLLK